VRNLPLTDLSDEDFEQLLEELKPPVNPGSGNQKQKLFQLERVGAIEVEIDGEDIFFRMPRSGIADLRLRRRK
jgi:hypothetical protein